MVISISVWYLFRVPMISFICFCVFSYSLIFLSWNFLSVSYMFWLTMSSTISKKFSLITCRISSFRVFCGLCWVPWYSLSLFCFSLDLGICFLHFTLNPVLLYFWVENGFSPFFSSCFSTRYHFYLWTTCTLVLAGNSINTNKTKREG
jgi:hypothetical protein